jgi:hypothetical protein
MALALLGCSSPARGATAPFDFRLIVLEGVGWPGEWQYPVLLVAGLGNAQAL